MSARLRNPFNITKAVDFSDQQIKDYWVDLPGGPGFREMAKPTSPMPMLILGGKGSGKTHLMRYFSYPLQKLRHSDVTAGLTEEGYVGIYLRCGGLNAARFTGKGQTPETWAAVFAYYMDLWLAQLTIETVRDALHSEQPLSLAHDLAGDIGTLFDQPVRWPELSLAGVLEALREWQRELDHAVNNAAITRTLQVSIRSSPGRLVFGVPRVIASRIGQLGDVQFLYLIDELENLAADQQRYVNTLIREKEAPCSFKIGARLYGIRTFETYSAGETNKEGSEYERLFLDDHLRENRNYPAFARRLCARRLVEAGYFSGDSEVVDGVAKRLGSFFESQHKGRFAADETRLLTDRQNGKPRPYLLSLAAQLQAGVRLGTAIGLRSEDDIDSVVGKLKVPAYPLLEKANLHLFYQEWSAGRDLRKAADAIAKDCSASVRDGKAVGRHKTILGHFQNDLLAQLYADFGQRPLYIGIETFIDMSRGLPRNLLVILKHVFQWASFNGENPFLGSPISRRSQQQGVIEAAQWFFRDAEVLGEEGSNVQDGVRRLAELFREIRFADKPAECSLSTFSTNSLQLTPRSRRVLDLAEKWSLLLRIRRGQRERNTRRIDAKYQINSMLAPLWDLPVARRGAIALTAEEVNSIFDPEHRNEFQLLKKLRVSRMRAPRFEADEVSDAEALTLFGNG